MCESIASFSVAVCCSITVCTTTIANVLLKEKKKIGVNI